MWIAQYNKQDMNSTNQWYRKGKEEENIKIPQKNQHRQEKARYTWIIYRKRRNKLNNANLSITEKRKLTQNWIITPSYQLKPNRIKIPKVPWWRCTDTRKTQSMRYLRKINGNPSTMKQFYKGSKKENGKEERTIP